MAKISLTKSGLQREKQQLQLYQKLLPTLELKRTQLMGQYSLAKSELERSKSASKEAIQLVSEKLPMLANPDVAFSGLVAIDQLILSEQNIVGVRVPFLKEVTFRTTPYSRLATPFWYDVAVAQIKKGVEANLRLRVMEKRIEKLSQAVRRMTQRVNLFEKILIPTAKKNIQKIQIALGDAERTAVIRSKLAKSMHTRVNL